MRKGALAICILLAMAVAFQFVAAAPDYLIQVREESAAVSISISAFQNLTLFSQFRNFSLPQFHVLGIGPNATGFEPRLDQAARVRAPQARISNLRLEAGTSQWLNTTQRQWLNLTARFTVSGIAANGPNGPVYNMTWKSLAVASNMTLGGYEVNRIGEAYFQNIAQTLSESRFTAQTRIFLRVNGQSMIFRLFPTAVRGITALNFTTLNTPLSQWHLEYVPLSGQESYNMTVKGLGLTFQRVITAEQEEVITNYGLFYNIQGRVDVPAGSHVNGDSVIHTSNIAETIMGGVTISIVALGSGAYFYERRLMKTPFRKRSKR